MEERYLLFVRNLLLEGFTAEPFLKGLLAVRWEASALIHPYHLIHQILDRAGAQNRIDYAGEWRCKAAHQIRIGEGPVAQRSGHMSV